MLFLHESLLWLPYTQYKYSLRTGRSVCQITSHDPEHHRLTVTAPYLYAHTYTSPTCRTTKASTATEAVTETAANTPTLSQLPGGAAATLMVCVKMVPCHAARARRRAHSLRTSLQATSENLNCLCARRVEIPWESIASISPLDTPLGPRFVSLLWCFQTFCRFAYLLPRSLINFYPQIKNLSVIYTWLWVTKLENKADWIVPKQSMTSCTPTLVS